MGGGLLFGNINSRVDSTSIREPENDSFSAKDSKDRIATVINSDVALRFSQPICDDLYELNFELGYRVDYYFKAVDRINPFNGYVVNQNTFPVTQSSNLGLGGPYFLISFQQALPHCRGALSCCPLTSTCMCSGLTFQFTSHWLKPTPTHDDLTYGILNLGAGEERGVRVDTDLSWAGTYELGYLFNYSYDFQAKYFCLEAADQDSVSAAPNQSISSLNASGPSTVVFREANSKARYRIHQFDFSLGKYMQLHSRINLYGFFGLRYLNLKRTQNNEYLGGSPPSYNAIKISYFEKSPIGHRTYFWDRARLLSL